MRSSRDEAGDESFRLSDAPFKKYRRRPAGKIETLSIDATRPVPVDFGAADLWRVLLSLDGVPTRYFTVPSPGTGSATPLTEAVIVRHADEARSYDDFVERFERRLGAAPPRPANPNCSVVVCTHRRSRYLPVLLDALARLDPRPDEVIVVDNDPGEEDSRVEVERAGARYVREDARGLDRARTAGLRHARGEIVAFTDDDCVPSEGWLGSLGELFEDPGVAAVTGPAFAYRLDTASQLRFEDSGGFRRGLRRRRLDWIRLPPPAASQAGAGANMIFRRRVLEELGDVFPAELDAGTPTESGGDLYALFRVLDAGHRVVYDPGTYVFHQHRADGRSLHRAFWGYGVGLSAALTKLLVEERELTVPSAWMWLWHQYARTLRRRLVGGADAVETRIAWDYLRGGLRGARAWRLSLAQARTMAPSDNPPGTGAPWVGAERAEPAIELDHGESRGGSPAMSVIVPTVSRPQALARCLDALSAQTLPSHTFEVIVVDDAPADGPSGRPTSARGPSAAPSHGTTSVRAATLDTRRIATAGVGAAGARNAGAHIARGETLLFLDDDLVPEPDLLAQHLERHRQSERPTLVVGYCAPRPVSRNLASQSASIWWEDHYQMKREVAAMTFVEVLSGNMSIPRETFRGLGGFDAQLGRSRREDWELGLRALTEGIEVLYERAARAAHEFRLDTRTAIQATRSEGHGDARLVRMHPIALPSLPARRSLRRLIRRPARALGLALLERDLACATALRVLDALEWAKARQAWFRLFGLVQTAAYEHGAREGGRRRHERRDTSIMLPVELLSTEPIPPPAVAAPLLDLRLNGRRVARIAPPNGHWHRSLSHAVASTLSWEDWTQLRLARPTAEPLETERQATVTVVFGPARRAGDDRYRDALEARGARVVILDGDRRAHWAEVHGAILASPDEIVATPLPGTAPRPDWVDAVRLALAGDRVAVAVGSGLVPDEPPWPLMLVSRMTNFRPYPAVGPAPQYLAVRRSLYEADRGLHSVPLRLGHQAPVLDLVDRALDAGHVVAHLQAPGLEPDGRAKVARWRREWLRRQARAGLMLGRARGARSREGWGWFAGQAIAPVARDLHRSLRYGAPSRHSGPAHVVAFLIGCALSRGDAR